MLKTRLVDELALAGEEHLDPASVEDYDRKARFDPSGDLGDLRERGHHLPDVWKAIALRRMADLLRPGGTLRLRDLVFAFEVDEADIVLSRWLETGAVRAEDGWTREELELHLRNEYSTFSWLLEPMIERAGFTIEQADYGSLRVYADYICTKRRR